MARTFELSVHVEPLSRGDGRSATAAAAYRACSVVECERTGIIHDYRLKRGHEATETVVPKKAGAWGRKAGALWNASEMREVNKDSRARSKEKANARVARDCMFSFPFALSEAGRLNAARIVALHVVETHGIGAMFSIHKPGNKGDERNFHCHLLMTTRRVTAKGMGEKAREWDDQKTGPELVKGLRAFIADTLNAELAKEGKADLVFVEHRSFAARGMAQKPQTHQGPARMHRQRKEQAKDRAAWFERTQAEQRERHGKELASVRVRQDFGLQSKLADLAQRQRTGEAEIQRRLDERRAADRAPTGARLAFLAITGRAGREAFDRQAREGQRTLEAAQEVAALKKDVQQERNLYVAGQTQERAALIERHGAEDRQLQQAFVSRESLDQSADRALQREQRNERGWQQEQDRQRLEQTRPRGRTRGGPDFTP